MNKIYSPYVLKAGLIVGTLDILAASIQYFIKTNKTPLNVYRFIASGVFGKTAFSGGYLMAGLGLVFHYLIALTFTILFFWLATRIPALLKSRIITGILYGIVIWLAMQFVVLPLSRVPSFTFDPSTAIVPILILIGCIGLPLSFMARKHLRSNLR